MPSAARQEADTARRATRAHPRGVVAAAAEALAAAAAVVAVLEGEVVAAAAAAEGVVREEGAALGVAAVAPPPALRQRSNAIPNTASPAMGAPAATPALENTAT